MNEIMILKNSVHDGLGIQTERRSKAASQNLTDIFGLWMAPTRLRMWLSCSALAFALTLMVGCTFSRGYAKLPPLAHELSPAVKVTTKCEGGVTHFYVENK